MAGPFPLHRSILHESDVLIMKWQELVVNITNRGTGIGEIVSVLESLVEPFNRERTLLGNLIYSKSNQLKQYKFWQKTREVNARLRAIDLSSLIGFLQTLHLTLTYVHFQVVISESNLLNYHLSFILFLQPN